MTRVHSIRTIGIGSFPGYTLLADHSTNRSLVTLSSFPTYEIPDIVSKVTTYYQSHLNVAPP
jgi:hypothetical protein